MSDNGGKKSMQHTRLVKCALGAGLVLSFGIFGKYMVSSSTTMGSETELAGMAYMLDQYCTIQVGATQSNPEAIVAFEDMPGNTNNGTSAVSGSAVSNATPEPTKEATATATPKPESEYANVGISIAADYVNIRKKPNTDAVIVGKLYRGSAATIAKTEGDWVYIKSGSVSGYIMKDYLAIGYSAEKLVDQFGTKWATVTTETLRVREKESESSKILDLLAGDESYEVLKHESGWVKVRVDGDTTGYVRDDYVKISVQFERLYRLRKNAKKREEKRQQRQRRQKVNVRRSLHRIQEIVRQAAVLQAAQVINRHQAQERVLRMVAVEVINQAVHPPVMAAVVRKEVPAAPVTVQEAQVETAAPVDPAMVPVVQAVVPHRPMAAAHWEAVTVLQLLLTL
mgnify:CR=1 FL=1